MTFYFFEHKIEADVELKTEDRSGEGKMKEGVGGRKRRRSEDEKEGRDPESSIKVKTMEGLKSLNLVRARRTLRFESEMDSSPSIVYKCQFFHRRQ